MAIELPETFVRSAAIAACARASCISNVYRMQVGEP